MHSLSAAFVLGYHGCSRTVGERLLQGENFLPSENDYDWLGTGIYVWEANPARARDWAAEVGSRRERRSGIHEEPFVVGAVINLGFCLDLINTNGIEAVEQAYKGLLEASAASHLELPVNEGGDDLIQRKMDCAVLEYLHESRQALAKAPFDTVRALFPESEPLYPGAGFRRKTHIQICVRNPACIKGVFRVPPHHFTD